MAELGYVYERLTPADHQTLAEIVHRFCPPPAYLLQERLDNLTLEELAPGWPADLSAVWPEGRVFNARYEVRWLQEGDGAYQVLLLTEQPPEGGPGKEWAEPVMYQTGEQLSFLWGDWDGKDGIYWQTNIPRSLPWPVRGREGVPYAALQTVEYRRGGVTLLTRLRGLVAVSQHGR